MAFRCPISSEAAAAAPATRTDLLFRQLAARRRKKKSFVRPDRVKEEDKRARTLSREQEAEEKRESSIELMTRC